MIITIDTAKDSPEDIRKAIAFLSSLHGAEARSSNIFESSDSDLTSDESSESSGVSAFANMFGDLNKSEEPKSDDGYAPVSEILPADEKTEDDEEETPEIMEY